MQNYFHTFSWLYLAEYIQNVHLILPRYLCTPIEGAGIITGHYLRPPYRIDDMHLAHVIFVQSSTQLSGQLFDIAKSPRRYAFYVFHRMHWMTDYAGWGR